MSQDIVLISIEKIENSDIKNILSENWRVGEIDCINGVTDLQVNKTDEVTRIFSYVTIGALVPSHEVANDYIDHEMLDDVLKTSLRSCSYYGVTFNCGNFFADVMRKILTSIGSKINTCWVDDGYGRLIPANIFLERLRYTI